MINTKVNCNLGTDVTDGGGYNSNARDMPFEVRKMGTGQ